MLVTFNRCLEIPNSQVIHCHCKKKQQQQEKNNTNVLMFCFFLSLSALLHFQFSHCPPTTYSNYSIVPVTLHFSTVLHIYLLPTPPPCFIHQPSLLMSAAWSCNLTSRISHIVSNAGNAVSLTYRLEWSQSCSCPLLQLQPRALKISVQRFLPHLELYTKHPMGVL